MFFFKTIVFSFNTPDIRVEPAFFSIWRPCIVLCPVRISAYSRAGDTFSRTYIPSEAYFSRKKSFFAPCIPVCVVPHDTPPSPRVSLMRPFTSFQEISHTSPFFFFSPVLIAFHAPLLFFSFSGVRSEILCWCGRRESSNPSQMGIYPLVRVPLHGSFCPSRGDCQFVRDYRPLSADFVLIL